MTTEPAGTLLLGLVSGYAFGFLLQKGRVTKYEVIVGQFLLRDFTMLKVILSAIVVGGFGAYVLVALGLAELSPKPAQLVAVPVGGLVFGVGMALLGYCPGTGIGAAAEGSRHALVGVVGMLVGAAAYSEAHRYFATSLLPLADLGKVTVAELLGLSPWTLLTMIALVSIATFAYLELGRRGPSQDTRARRQTAEAPASPK